MRWFHQTPSLPSRLRSRRCKSQQYSALARFWRARVLPPDMVDKSFSLLRTYVGLVSPHWRIQRGASCCRSRHLSLFSPSPSHLLLFHRTSFPFLHAPTG